LRRTLLVWRRVLSRIGRFFKSIRRPFAWLNRLFDRRPWIYGIVVALVIIVAGLCRLWAVPLSAGPDVGQFWGFAKMFQLHGLDFYRYADGTDPIFPVPGWGFVYPPIWLFILRIALLASHGSTATSTMVDVSWRVAMKTPIIAADLAIGGLLLWAIPGSKLKKLGFASIWLFHPTSWYNSAVFGQFDAIAAALLLTSVLLFVRGKDRWGFIVGGLAVMTKQHAALPLLLVLVVVSRQIPWRRFVANCAIVAGMAAALSIPFLLTGNLIPYARSVLLPAEQPAYQEPLVFALSGPGALITYLHDAFKWSIEPLLRYSTPLLVTGIVAASVVCYVKRVNVAQAALIGILLFIGLFYRVNYQYLVIYLPLAIFAIAVSQTWAEKGLAIALVVVPAVWIWLFDVSFWFWYQAPKDLGATDLLARAGLTHSVPDYAYVSLAGTIMLLCLAYVVVELARRHNQPSQAVVSGG